MEREAKAMDSREALEFLIRFGAVDPMSLRPGDLLNLIDDTRRYLDVQGDGKVARELEHAKSEPRALKPVIAAVRKLIDAAVDKQCVSLSSAQTIVFDGSLLGKSDRGVVFYDGKLCDVMIVSAIDDFGDLEPWQTGRCEEAECRKIFLAARKGQRFCTHSCANATASRAYREAHAKKIAANANKRYWREKVAQAERKEG